MPTISAYATSVIRTLAGYLVGLLLSVPIASPIEHAAGIDDAHARTWLAAAVVFVLGTLYYVIVRAVERRWPAAGALLGVPTRPVYELPTTGRHDASHAEHIAAVTGAQIVTDEP